MHGSQNESKRELLRFLPAELLLVERERVFKVQVVTHQEGNLLVERLTRIHGSFTVGAAHAFHRERLDPEFSSTDIRRIDEGLKNPSIIVDDVFSNEKKAEVINKL